MFEDLLPLNVVKHVCRISWFLWEVAILEPPKFAFVAIRISHDFGELGSCQRQDMVKLSNVLELQFLRILSERAFEVGLNVLDPLFFESLKHFTNRLTLF
jgi:hypothetical protein